MQIRAEQHQKRVEKPGRTSKEVFAVGERVWVQNFQSKKWDQEGHICAIRTAADGKIVSYDLTVNGHPTMRHRKFLRKCLGSVQADPAVSIDDTAPQAPRRSERQRQSKQLSAQQSSLVAPLLTLSSLFILCAPLLFMSLLGFFSHIVGNLELEKTLILGSKQLWTSRSTVCY